MPAKKYFVDLTTEEQDYLHQLLSRGKSAARKVKHAHILLKARDGYSDAQIVSELSTSTTTVERVRRRFVEEGLESALTERPRPGASPKLNAKQVAHLTAIACSTAPGGRARWTLRLLADKMVELDIVDSLSYETVRETLKKTVFNRGAIKSGASLPSGQNS